MANLTGARHCAECETELTEETVLSGDAGPFTITVRKHNLAIPGLYVCTPCAGAIMTGEKETSVTWDEILTFLDEVLGPQTVAFLFTTQDDAMATVAAGILQEIMDISTVLEMLIAARDEGVLDSIPECDGKCGQHSEEGEVHPRDMAAVN